MRKSTLLVLFIAACGSSGPGSTGGGHIPDPGTGNGVDNNFGNVEPNDTPAQATPLGVSMLPGVNVWVNGNTTSGSDGSDYFVFKSGGQGPFTFNICWQAGITSMSATLWKVSGGQQVMPPVHQWASSSNCLQTAAGDAMLEASTAYLFGIQTMGAGMYSA